MKINFKTIVAAMATTLAVGACSDYDELASNSSSRAPKDGTPVERTFETIFEEMEGDVMTRTTDGFGKYPVLWSTGDQIAVFDGSLTTRTFTLQSGAGTATGTFKGESLASDEVYAIYPYYAAYSETEEAGVIEGVYVSSTYQGTDATKGQNDQKYPCKVLMGKTVGDKIQFKNITSRIDLTINGLESGTTAVNVYFTANGGECIAGNTLKLDWNNGDPKVVGIASNNNAFSFVRVNGTTISGTTATTPIYFLPQTLASGYTICVEANVGGATKKYYFHNNNSLTYKRNKVYNYSLNIAKANGIGSVDLGLDDGLSVNALNEGALHPVDAGDFYAYGETKTKTAYTWDSYRWTDSGTTDTDVKLGKYILYGSEQYNLNGLYDGKSTLDYEDDVAYVNSKGLSHIPTITEAQEIIDNVTTEIVRMSGKNFLKLTSKKNGKSVLIYCAGANNNTAAQGEGDVVLTLSATAHALNRYVYKYLGSTKQASIDTRRRYVGYPVRGVSSKTSHPYVDMGEAGKWATCNVGAVTPEGFGYYYAYAETATKTAYTSDNYSPISPERRIIDANDAATVNWGTNWRTPTEAEFKALIDACNWTKIITSTDPTKDARVEGWLGTHKTNGNKIFFPSAGVYGNGADGTYYPYYNTSTGGHGYEGYYMTKESLYIGDNSTMVFQCTPNSTASTKPKTMKWYYLYKGISVRPIMK